jgi:hypothetical protein
MTTEVDPGNIELFGKRMQELADYWSHPQGAPMKVLDADRGSIYFPEPGDHTEGDAWRQAYDGKRGQLGQTFGALYQLLETLGKGSKKIAEKYANAEALSNAKVGQIDAILAQEGLGGTGAPGQTPGQTPPGQTPPAPAA